MISFEIKSQRRTIVFLARFPIHLKPLANVISNNSRQEALCEIK